MEKLRSLIFDNENADKKSFNVLIQIIIHTIKPKGKSKCKSLPLKKAKESVHNN